MIVSVVPPYPCKLQHQPTKYKFIEAVVWRVVCFRAAKSVDSEAWHYPGHSITNHPIELLRRRSHLRVATFIRRTILLIRASRFSLHLKQSQPVVDKYNTCKRRGCRNRGRPLGTKVGVRISYHLILNRSSYYIAPNNIKREKNNHALFIHPLATITSNNQHPINFFNSSGT